MPSRARHAHATKADHGTHAEADDDRFGPPAIQYVNVYVQTFWGIVKFHFLLEDY